MTDTREELDSQVAAINALRHAIIRLQKAERHEGENTDRIARVKAVLDEVDAIASAIADQGVSSSG